MTVALILFLLLNKVEVSSNYRNQLEGLALLLRTHFSSKSVSYKDIGQNRTEVRAHSHTCTEQESSGKNSHGRSQVSIIMKYQAAKH